MIEPLVLVYEKDLIRRISLRISSENLSLTRTTIREHFEVADPHFHFNPVFVDDAFNRKYVQFSQPHPTFNIARQITDKPGHIGSVNNIVVKQYRHVHDFPDYDLIIYNHRFFGNGAFISQSRTHQSMQPASGET